MCWSNAFAVIFCVTAPAAGSLLGSGELDFQHVSPASLNEAAARRVAAGELGTAQILLERAAVMDPTNVVVAANLAALRAYRQRPGGVMVTHAADGVALPPATIPIPAPVPPGPELPPLWKSR